MLGMDDWTRKVEESAWNDAQDKDVRYFDVMYVNVECFL